MRRFETQTALQENLTRGRNQQVLSADDMRYALFGVVGDHGKLVCPVAVRPQQYEIADVARQILRIMSDDFIIETDGFVGNADAPCGLFVRFRRPVRRIAATAAVNKPVRTGRSRRLPVFPAAITRIHQPFVFQTA